MKEKWWGLILVLVFVLIGFTYSPWVIPNAVYTPELGNIPYNLWMSFFITCLMVVLTYMGTRFHPCRRNKQEEE